MLCFQDNYDTHSACHVSIFLSHNLALVDKVDFHKTCRFLVHTLYTQNTIIHWSLLNEQKFILDYTGLNLFVCLIQRTNLLIQLNLIPTHTKCLWFKENASTK